MTIRACDNSHLQGLTALEKDCFSLPWNEGMLAGTLARVDFVGYVIEEQNELLGYICGTSLFETAEVARVAVRSAHRRKGIGEKLLTAFLEKAKEKGAEQVFLEVRASNVPAMRLYEKLGFVKWRLRPKYYADGEDGQEMIKRL